MMTDVQLAEMFHAWWRESYSIPPAPHALMTHLSWARHLLQRVQEQQQQQHEQSR